MGSYSTLVKDNGIAVEVNDVEGLANAVLTLKANHRHYTQEAIKLSESTYLRHFHKSKILENYLLQYSNDAKNSS